MMFISMPEKIASLKKEHQALEVQVDSLTEELRNAKFYNHVAYLH